MVFGCYTEYMDEKHLNVSFTKKSSNYPTPKYHEIFQNSLYHMTSQINNSLQKYSKLILTRK